MENLTLDTDAQIQKILELADELSSLSIKLACDLDSKSEFYSPYEASETLEMLLDTAQQLTAPEQFSHIKQFVKECEEETIELQATKDWGMQSNAG